MALFLIKKLISHLISKFNNYHKTQDLNLLISQNYPHRYNKFTKCMIYGNRKNPLNLIKIKKIDELFF